MHTTLLGTAGWMPSPQRETACISVRLGKSLILLDAGTGLRRLVTDPYLISGVESIHVLLSHFHLDHVVGLSYLSALPGDRPVHIAGPGSWLYGTSTRDILADFIRPPYQPYRLADKGFHIEELGPTIADIDGLGIHVRAQFLHSAPSVGFRLGDSLAYLTDTAFDQESQEFASGVTVLIHEAFSDNPGDRTHSSASEAASVAAAAGVEYLYLVHIAPWADESTLLENARSNFPSALIGQDGDRLTIPRGLHGGPRRS